MDTNEHETPVRLQSRMGSEVGRLTCSRRLRPDNRRLQDRRPTIAIAAVALLASLIAGCSIPMPQAQSDPTKYYVLSVVAPQEAPAQAEAKAPAQAEAKAPAVRLRPVELPSYLRGEPLVVRRGPNQIQFLEFSRWGEPLEQGIARVLREELLARGAATSVDTGLRPGSGGDMQADISVRVLACEGNADGTVNFAAAWEIDPTAPGGAVRRGEFHASGLKWTPHDDASLAAALSHAVAGLAGEIAGGLAKL